MIHQLQQLQEIMIRRQLIKNTYPRLGKTSRQGEGSQEQPRSGTFQNPTGTNGLQSGHFPAGGKLQQPSPAVGNSRRGRPDSRKTLQDQCGDFYDW